MAVAARARSRRKECSPIRRLSRTVSPGKVIFPPTSSATPWSMICSGSR